MKYFLTLFLFFFIFCAGSYAQLDDTYYNYKRKYKVKENHSYPFYIFADIARPFYKDINLNFEVPVKMNTTIGFGLGYYRPSEYIFKYEIDEKLTLVTDKAGFRVAARLRSYFMDYIDGIYGDFLFAYNKLPGIAYTNYAMMLGGIIPIYKNIVLSPELGLELDNYGKNDYAIDLKAWHAGVALNISLGYRFGSNDK